MATYTVQGRVTSKINGKAIPYATVEIFEVDPAGGSYVVDAVVTIPPVVTTDANGYFKASFNFLGEPGRPDIIVRVSQKVSGITQYIYSENPAVQTRWNIADVLYVDIKVEAETPTMDPPPTGQPPGNYFIFTRVGNIPVASISQTNGYAYPDPGTNPVHSMDSNQPFGGTLWIGGWFGKALLLSTQLKYYKIQYATGVHLPSSPGPWVDISDPLVNYHFDVAAKQWVAESMGPSTVAGIKNLYRSPWDTDTIPWTFPDLLITMDSTKISAGLYTLRVIGYASQGPLLVERPLNPDPTYGTLKLELDNTPPGLTIKTVKHISATNVVTEGPCKIFPFSNGKVSVDFQAYDVRGHLRRYNLYALYGHNQVVMPPPTTPNKAEDDYSTHVVSALKWLGSYSGGVPTIFTIDYKATPPEPDATGYNSIEMPTCAYQFRLVVDKRTTNGYGLVYWGYEDNYHVTIQR